MVTPVSPARTRTRTAGQTGRIRQSRRPQRHHVASNKGKVSGYTALFVHLFARAGTTLRHEANILLHPQHGRGDYAGAHGAKYNRWVLGRLERALEGLEGAAYKRALFLELVATFFVANVLNLVAALDVERSAVTYFGPERPDRAGEIKSIERPVLRRAAVEGYDVLRLAEYPLALAVSDGLSMPSRRPAVLATASRRWS